MNRHIDIDGNAKLILVYENPANQEHYARLELRLKSAGDLSTIVHPVQMDVLISARLYLELMERVHEAKNEYAGLEVKGSLDFEVRTPQ